MTTRRATFLAKAGLVLLAVCVGASVGTGIGWLLPTLHTALRGDAHGQAAIREADFSVYFTRRQESVLMFSTSWCPVCRRAREFFDAQGIAYHDMDIEADAHNSKLYDTLGVDVIPVIMVRNKMLTGFDEGTLRTWITELRLAEQPSEALNKIPNKMPNKTLNEDRPETHAALAPISAEK